MEGDRAALLFFGVWQPWIGRGAEANVAPQPRLRRHRQQAERQGGLVPERVEARLGGQGGAPALCQYPTLGAVARGFLRIKMIEPAGL